MELTGLFEPIKIGTVEIRNRIVMPAMDTNYGDGSGYVTQRLVNYYRERARGGAGLVITEIVCIDAPLGRDSQFELCIHNDSYIPGLSQLSQAIAGEGARSVLQLYHPGRRVPRKIAGMQPVAPSPIAEYGRDMPRALTIEEIEALVAAFARGACRAREAGFDGVEIHAAHGYLVSQFLSPLTNVRQDKYGGNPDGRARFALEIIQRIRATVGKDYLLSIRISADEYLEGGLTLKDSKYFSLLLKKAGVDVINVSAAAKPSSEPEYRAQLVGSTILPMSFPRGYFVHLAEEIRKTSGLPVITVGRINDPALANQVIKNGQADVVAMGRALIADPEMPRKALEGKDDEIRKCTACNTCINSMRLGNMICAINAESGREGEFRSRSLSRPKLVLVAGGGPAGMESARVAASRGHRVILFEKSRRLGGNLLPASAPSFKAELAHVVPYLANQLKKLAVEVHLGQAVTAELVEKVRPEVVLVATGARPAVPVASPGKISITSAVDVLNGIAEVKQNVIVVGGGSTGCEVAVFLAEKGKSVTVVEMLSARFTATSGLASDMDPALRRWLLFHLWPRLGINVIDNSRFQEVTDKGILVLDREARIRHVEGDTVVFATGLTPNRDLCQELEGKVKELYAIGDCVEPRRLDSAIHEGAAIGWQL